MKKMETSEKRVYVLACQKDAILYVMGVYTNKKVLLDAMNTLGTEDCYIKAKRKNVAVSAGSLHTNFNDRINIYSKDEFGNEVIKFKAIELKLNKFNHIIQSRFSEISSELFG